MGFLTPKLSARLVKNTKKAAKTAGASVASTAAPAYTTTKTYGTPAPSSKRRTNVDATLARIQKAYASGPKVGSTYSPSEAASLAQSVGASKQEARDLSTKIVGESGGNPKAIGHDPGGTTGLGLWQITTGVGNDQTINKYGGEKAMLKPKPNAKAALNILRSSGLGAWYAPSNAPGKPGKVKPKVKVDPKDRAYLKKVGAAVPRSSAKDTSTPLATKKVKGNPAKIINPKWDPNSDSHGETFLAKGISPVVKKWSQKYNILVGEAKADSGHVSPGHLVTGTATDVYPKQNTDAGWNELERGISVLGKMGFEVGYDGSVAGTQNWPGHGRGNHAHIEWVGQGTSDDAIKKLSGLSGAALKKMATSGGGSGGIPSAGGVSSGGGGSVGGATKGKSSRQDKILQRSKALKKVTAYYPDSQAPSSAAQVSKRFSSKPVI